MSSSSVIVLVASLTLASALVVNRIDVATPFNPLTIVDNSRHWDMGVELTKSLVETQFAYVVEVADFLSEPRLNNDFQQNMKDNEETKHTNDFLKQCERTASKIIQNGGSTDRVRADFKAACDLHPEGWPQQICQQGQKSFLKEAQSTQSFTTANKGTTVQAKDDFYAKEVCEEMQFHIMETLKANQKAQEDPFVRSEDMKEEDEDKGDANEIEMDEEAKTGTTAGLASS